MFNELFYGSPGGYKIERSLRFDSADTPYLSQTPSSGLDTKTWTISLWIKKVSASGYVIRAGEFYLYFTSDQLHYYDWSGSTNGVRLKTNAVFRDPSAWYHIVLANDTTQATATNRHRLYVNGKEVTSFATDSAASQNATSYLFNSVYSINIGGATALNYPDCYLAEVHFVHGSQLEPSDFGETDPGTGSWIPKKYSGSHGTGGSYLNFSDNSGGSAIGTDSSGNGNNWTATGFELTDTTSTSYDWMEDSPTQNYATLNPLVPGQSPFAGANLSSLNTSNVWSRDYGSIAIPRTGSYYWETVIGGNTGAFERTFMQSYVSTGSGYEDSPTSGTVWYERAGGAGVDTTTLLTTTTFGYLDRIGYGYNATTNTVELFKNGASVGTFTVPDRQYYVAVAHYASSASYDFGQQNVAHIPAGYSSLSTALLPAVDITNPSDHFEVITDTGANILTAAQAKFPNGLWWIKDRVNANQHQFVNSVRGASLAFSCPGTTAEAAYVAPTGNSVAWCWATPGTPAANNDGTIQSTVDADIVGGFSIVNWLADGSNANGVGHGLSQTPEFIIYRTLNLVNNSGTTAVWTTFTGSNQYVPLSSNNASSTIAAQYGSPTSTTISNYGYGSGNNMLAYCWHSVPGYSAFGSYTGNGNADGPFVYTNGFKPAFVMTKSTTVAQGWQILDSTRNTYNPYNDVLYANLTNKENVTIGNIVDFLSNGFKLRGSDAITNQSGQTYIYAAFAEHPFGGSNVSPTTAR